MTPHAAVVGQAQAHSEPAGAPMGAPESVCGASAAAHAHSDQVVPVPTGALARSDSDVNIVTAPLQPTGDGASNAAVGLLALLGSAGDADPATGSASGASGEPVADATRQLPHHQQQQHTIPRQQQQQQLQQQQHLQRVQQQTGGNATTASVAPVAVPSAAVPLVASAASAASAATVTAAAAAAAAPGAASLALASSVPSLPPATAGGGTSRPQRHASVAANTAVAAQVATLNRSGLGLAPTRASASASAAPSVTPTGVTPAALGSGAPAGHRLDDASQPANKRHRKGRADRSMAGFGKGACISAAPPFRAAAPCCGRLVHRNGCEACWHRGGESACHAAL